jgi:hypothetical protein
MHQAHHVSLQFLRALARACRLPIEGGHSTRGLEAMMNRCVAIACLAANLTACAPYAIDYVDLDAPGVTYRRFPCSEGAHVGVSYAVGDVRFEVTLEPHGLSPLRDPYLKIRAPRNVMITIPEPVARVTQGSSTTLVHLAPRALDWQGPYVDAMRRASPLAEYQFAFVDLPAIVAAGTVELPAVHADGKPLASPTLTFRRDSKVGIAPLNC